MAWLLQTMNALEDERAFLTMLEETEFERIVLRSHHQATRVSTSRKSSAEYQKRAYRRRRENQGLVYISREMRRLGKEHIESLGLRWSDKPVGRRVSSDEKNKAQFLREIEVEAVATAGFAGLRLGDRSSA